MEIWKDIEWYDNAYQVSNKGRVRSVDRELHVKWNGKTEYIRHIKGSIIKQKKLRHGYMAVVLNSQDKGKVQFTVHRLVCKAFNDNPYNLPFVNHKDENKQNNDYSNLEWCTASYNIRYGTCIDRVKESLRNNIGRQVCQYSITGELIKVHRSIVDASERKGIGSSNIEHSASQNYTKCITAGGFRWAYKGHTLKPYDEFTGNRGTRVDQNSVDGVHIKTFRSMLDAENKTGVNRKLIKKCIDGDIDIAGGYIWKHKIA